MKDEIVKQFSILKTTAVGGLVFILPFVVICALLGYVVQIVMLVYEPLKDWLPFHTAWGLSLLFLIAVLIILLLCFLCGIAARRALAKSFTKKIEKQLVTVFPKYAILKDILAGNIGGDDLAPTLKPVAVRFNDHIRIGYEAGRTARNLVIVYLPGSPDPWIGSVALVAEDKVEPLPLDFGETSAVCERLGRESGELLGSITP